MIPEPTLGLFSHLAVSGVYGITFGLVVNVVPWKWFKNTASLEQRTIWLDLWDDLVVARGRPPAARIGIPDAIYFGVYTPYCAPGLWVVFGILFEF